MGTTVGGPASLKLWWHKTLTFVGHKLVVFGEVVLLNKAKSSDSEWCSGSGSGSGSGSHNSGSISFNRSRSSSS